MGHIVKRNFPPLLASDGITAPCGRRNGHSPRSMVQRIFAEHGYRGYRLTGFRAQWFGEFHLSIVKSPESFASSGNSDAVRSGNSGGLVPPLSDRKSPYAP